MQNFIEVGALTSFKVVAYHGVYSNSLIVVMIVVMAVRAVGFVLCPEVELVDICHLGYPRLRRHNGAYR